MKNKIEIVEDGCSYEDKNGTIKCTCEDLPVTYCRKCRRFYVVEKGGGRDEINILGEQYTETEEEI